MTRERLNGLAWAIIDSNRYMALGTAGPDGHMGFAHLVRLGDRHRLGLVAHVAVDWAGPPLVRPHDVAAEVPVGVQPGRRRRHRHITAAERLTRGAGPSHRV